MATQGSFKHTSKYAATATKYGTREDGDEADPSKNTSGVWDGFKERGPTARKNARLGDREKLLDKDYMAEMRKKREQSNSVMTQVRGCYDGTNRTLPISTTHVFPNARFPEIWEPLNSRITCLTHRFSHPLSKPKQAAVLCVAVACVWLAVMAFKTWGGGLPSPINWNFNSPAAPKVDANSTPVATADDDESERSVKSAFVDQFDPDHKELPKAPPPPNAPPMEEQSPENQQRMDDAKEKRATANAARNDLLSGIEDLVTKQKTRILSDAAIAGVLVKEVEADITAASAQDACAQFFTKMHVDASLATCEVSVAETSEGGKSYVEDDFEPEEAKMAKSGVQEANIDVKEDPEGADAKIEKKTSSAPTKKAQAAAPVPQAPTKASVAQRQKDKELEDTKKQLEELKKLLEEKEANEKEHSEAASYEDELAANAKSAPSEAKEDTAPYEDRLERSAETGEDPEERTDGLPTEMDKAAMQAEMEALKQDLGELDLDDDASSELTVDDADDTSSYEEKLAQSAETGEDLEEREDGLPTEMDKAAMQAEMDALKEDLDLEASLGDLTLEEAAAATKGADLGLRGRGGVKSAAARLGANADNATTVDTKVEAVDTNATEVETKGDDEAEAPSTSAAKGDDEAEAPSASAAKGADEAEAPSESANDETESSKDDDAEAPSDDDSKSYMDAYEDELRESVSEEEEKQATVASTEDTDAYVDFVVSVMLTPTDFPEGVLDAAVSALSASGVPIEANDEKPTEALAHLDGVDGDKLQELLKDAKEAAEAEAAILYPPPPSPNPPPPAPFYPTAHAPPATPWPPEPPDAPRSPPPAPRPPPPPPPIDKDAAMATMFSHAPPPLDEKAARSTLFAVTGEEEEKKEKVEEEEVEVVEEDEVEEAYSAMDDAPEIEEENDEAYAGMDEMDDIDDEIVEVEEKEEEEEEEEEEADNVEDDSVEEVEELAEPPEPKVEDEDQLWWYKQQGKGGEDTKVKEETVEDEKPTETKSSSHTSKKSTTEKKSEPAGWWEEEADAAESSKKVESAKKEKEKEEEEEAFEKLFAANPSLQGDGEEEFDVDEEDVDDVEETVSDVDSEEDSVDYAYDSMDPEQKQREREEAAAEAKHLSGSKAPETKASKTSSTATKTDKSASMGSAKKRSKKSKASTGEKFSTSSGVTYDVYESANALHQSKHPSPPMLYPSPPPPEPPDYSDVYEAATLAMTTGVGVKTQGDAQMKLIANEILLMENEIGVNKFNHLFEAYSQPAVVAGKATEKDVDETEELDELEKDELEKQKRDQAKIEAYKKKSAKRHVRRYGPK